MSATKETRTPLASVAIVGLGYVGLPTALALHGRCKRVIGIDALQSRLDVIRAGDADLNDADRETLIRAASDGSFEMTTEMSAMGEADAVIICVPTPVTEANEPDLAMLRAACGDAVRHARWGQTFILTSTTYIGTTREMLARPLAERGLEVGSDVFVAFSPERIDPGVPEHYQRTTPRVVGGMTERCTAEAVRVLREVTDSVHVVSSPEAAEATKLYENIQRAVVLALANEFSDDCRSMNLDPIEVTEAAATKPYSFQAVNPGPGVGGHCIPVDPHYLLWQLRQAGRESPLIAQAMRQIDARPAQVVARARAILGGRLAGKKVIIAGTAYKPGVKDLRSSPAIVLIDHLRTAGAKVSYHDPLVPVMLLKRGILASTPDPDGGAYDLAIIHTVHPGVSYAWAGDCPQILDTTSRFTSSNGSARHVL
jgi:UDP-N-acetyl-D-glucosamine dehydrogenase